MPQITIYQKPTCTTCRKVHTALLESGVDFNVVNYYVDLIPAKKLKELLMKMGMSAEQLLRKKEPIYQELIGGHGLSEDEIIEIMAKNPDLIERPIVEVGHRAILARPAERLNEILV